MVVYNNETSHTFSEVKKYKYLFALHTFFRNFAAYKTKH